VSGRSIDGSVLGGRESYLSGGDMVGDSLVSLQWRGVIAQLHHFLSLLRADYFISSKSGIAKMILSAGSSSQRVGVSGIVKERSL
jgi:hypothetical protein